MQSVLEAFSNLLAARLAGGVFTTEDSVRYMFFVALMREAGIEPEEIVLEYPHPAISGEIDTWVPEYDGRTLAIEFKYDRHASNATQRAGAVFRDLHRLLVIDGEAVRRIFIYLTAREMASYFENAQNRFTDFWNLKPGSVLMLREDYFATRSATFSTSCGGKFEAQLVSLHHASLPQKHILKAWDIQPVA